MMKNIQVETESDDPFKPSWLTIMLAPLLVVAPAVAVFVWVFHSLPIEIRGLPTHSPDWNSDAEAWKTWNWHPVLMVLFLSLGALAIFAYKMLPGGHFFQKLVHTFFHTLAITCSIAGFAVEYWWKNKTGNYHFWTLHSWLGIAVLVMYWLQYVVGLVSFLLPGPMLIAKRIRAQIVLGHRHVGLILVVLVGGTILSGIAGREWYLLVGQARHWPVLGDVRKASYTTPNALGLFTGSLIVLCLFVFRHIKPAQDDHHYSPIRDIEYR